MLRISLDHDLANADWPKRTPDGMEDLQEDNVRESYREHEPGGSAHGKKLTAAQRYFGLIAGGGKPISE